MGRAVFCLITALLAAFHAALAFDTITVEAGRSYPSAAKIVRIGAARDWRRWDFSERWRLHSQWEARIGYWENVAAGEETPDVWEFTLTSVLRLQRQTSDGIVPYLESGVGAHLLSEKRVSERREFGGNFQFGSHVGLGVLLGPQHAYDVSLRVQHLSNARLYRQNDGINFATLRLGYRW